MSAFGHAVAFVLAHEGSRFTDDPRDPGGATRYGVTHSTLDKARETLHDLPAHVRDLSRHNAERIYRVLYWDAISGDMLPPATALSLFDWTVHSGSHAARALQRIVFSAGLHPGQVDGDVGPVTIARVRHIVGDSADTDRDLAVTLIRKRCDFLDDWLEGDPAKRVDFAGGFMRRLVDLTEACCLVKGG